MIFLLFPLSRENVCYNGRVNEKQKAALAFVGIYGSLLAFRFVASGVYGDTVRPILHPILRLLLLDF